MNVGAEAISPEKSFSWILGFAGMPSCEVGYLRRGSGVNSLTVRSA